MADSTSNRFEKQVFTAWRNPSARANPGNPYPNIDAGAAALLRLQTGPYGANDSTGRSPFAAEEDADDGIHGPPNSPPERNPYPTISSGVAALLRLQANLSTGADGSPASADIGPESAASVPTPGTFDAPWWARPHPQVDAAFRVNPFNPPNPNAALSLLDNNNAASPSLGGAVDALPTISGGTSAPLRIEGRNSPAAVLGATGHFFLPPAPVSSPDPSTLDGVVVTASKPAPTERRNPIGHPGALESLIPIWGSGREALADAYDGDWGGAALNGALTAADVFLGAGIEDGLLKGALKLDGSHTWRATRAYLKNRGLIEKGVSGHHWLIPQNGWGKAIPDFIKNQAPNILPIADPVIHGRLHGPWKGLPEFNVLEKFLHGTPTWAKVGVGSTVGHPVATVYEKTKSGAR